MNKNRILIDFSQSPSVKFGKSVPRKVFSSVWVVKSEVNNGGFSQYFGNSSAETAAFVAEALDTIGAPRTAHICRRAVACAFPSGLPPAPEQISDFSDETLDELASLDDEFTAYPHDLTELLFAYVSAHPEEFGSGSKLTA